MNAATGRMVGVQQWAEQRAGNAKFLNTLDNDLAAVKRFLMEKVRIGSGRNDA